LEELIEEPGQAAAPVDLHISVELEFKAKANQVLSAPGTPSREPASPISKSTQKPATTNKKRQDSPASSKNMATPRTLKEAYSIEV